MPPGRPCVPPGRTAYWLNRELWEVELEGKLAETDYKLVAERGRLVRRIERWDERTFRGLADSCAVQARKLGVVEIAGDCEVVIKRGAYALAIYFAAVAAERTGGEEGRLAERARQADWIAEHVLAAERRRLFRRRS